MTRISKRQLIDVVARKSHTTKREAEEVVEVFLNEIGRCLSKGDEVLLSGFGKFRVEWMEGKTVKIPNTDKQVTIKRHRAPRFTAGKKLKRQAAR